MVGSLLVADGCTKPLTHQAFEQFQQRLGLERPFESLHTLTRRLSMSQEGVLAAVWSFFFRLGACARWQWSFGCLGRTSTLASRGYITGPREIGYFQKHAWSRWNGVTPEFEVTLPAG